MPSANKDSLSTVLTKWWRVARIWFFGEERWAARGYVVLVLGLALLTTRLYVWISYAQRNFSTALSGKDVAGFYAAVWQFALIILVAAPLFSFTSWVEERLVLAWRVALTRHLTGAYFSNMSYYHMRQRVEAAGGSSSSIGSAGAGGGIDNPDQRICDDAAAFVRSSVNLSLSLARKLFNCVAFAGVLWGVSHQLVIFLFGYAIVGTAVTTAVFGRPLTSLYFRQLAREADMRFALVRVRENAESIAFYRGERSERRAVLARLGAVLAVTLSRINWGAAYDVWTSCYNYATILVPSLITAPRYFAGEIEFGVISQAGYAFSTIESALSVIVNNLASLSGLAAETDRLDGLLAAVAACHAHVLSEKMLMTSLHHQPLTVTRRCTPGQRGLRLKGLCVVTPSTGGNGAVAGAGGNSTALDAWSLDGIDSGSGADGVVLVKDLTLELRPGQSLLVVGPSGCGKSSLLRALAGLWTRGCGVVEMPPEACTMFLPQRAFMPLGTLRRQLTFPALHAGEEDASCKASASCGTAPAYLWRKLMGSRSVGVGGTRKLPGGGPCGHANKRDEDTEDDPGADDAPAGSSGGGSRSRAGSRELRPLLGASAGSTGRSGLQPCSSTSMATSVQLPESLSAGSSPYATVAVPLMPAEPAAHTPTTAGFVTLTPPPPDSVLLDALEEACLPDLAAKVGGLDAEVDWASVLSAGEQQRLAMARLLVAATTWGHAKQEQKLQEQPHGQCTGPNLLSSAGAGDDAPVDTPTRAGLELVFLDEATAALDGTAEACMYTSIRQHIPCYISVGHRLTLLDYHTHVLEFLPESPGQWQLHTVQDYRFKVVRHV